MEEKKEEIISELEKTLRLTRCFDDLKLTYNRPSMALDDAFCEAVWNNGKQSLNIDITADSGIAMITDIVNALYQEEVF